MPSARTGFLTAAGFTYERAEEAVWQIVSEAIGSGELPHTASRSIHTDPEHIGTPVEGATCVRSVDSGGQSVGVWQAADGYVATVAWSDGDVTVRAYAATPDAARRLAEGHAAAYPPAEPLSDGNVRIRFWFDGPFGPNSRVRALACPSWEDIAGNYPSAAREQLAALAALRPTDDLAGRLMLWHGPPGTGKSYLLRGLAREWSDWADTHYVTDPDEMLRQASYLTEMLADSGGDDRWRLIVLEDSGEFAASDARERSGAGLGRLLNAADGLLGQGTRTMFLVTTNEPVESLHPAVTRPGRCLANIELGPFPPEEAAQWLGFPVDVPLTLAEMWDRRRADRDPTPAATAPARPANRTQEGPVPTAAATWRIVPLEGNRCRLVRPDGRSRVIEGDSPEQARAAAAAVIGDALRAELTAAAPVDDEREPFTMIAGFPGAETTDGRVWRDLRLRTFPWPFMYQPTTDDGHMGSVLVGRVDEGEIVPSEVPGMAPKLRLRGSYDRRIPDAEAALVALQNGVDGVSWDTGGKTVEWECMAWDEYGWCDSDRPVLVGFEAAMVTQVGFPAFAEARLVLGATPPDVEMPLAPEAPEPPPPMTYDDCWAEPAPCEPESEDDRVEVVVIRADAAPCAGDCSCGGTCGGAAEALVAAAAVLDGSPPPAEWFDDPRLDAATPLTVTDEGRVFGHIAAWGTCHVGIANECVTPERVLDPAGTYADFRLSRPWGDARPPTGVLSYGGGHAPRGVDARTAMAHYDNVCTAWADVVMGHDAHGIWVAGAARPAIMRDPEALMTVRGGLPSGDWRPIGGRATLIAVLQVNTPGFPIRQPELVASAAGEILSITGYGIEPFVRARRMPWLTETNALAARLARVEAAYGPLLDLAAGELAASVARPEPATVP